MPVLDTQALVHVRSWTDFLDSAAIAELLPELQAFVTSRRWYRAKTRDVQEMSIEDVIPMPEAESAIIVVRFDYTEGDCDNYLVPVSVAHGAEAVSIEADAEDFLIARVEGPRGEKGILYGALWNQRFCDELLSAVSCSTTYEGREGRVAAKHTSAFHRACGTKEPDLRTYVSRAEQSNSSIIYGDQFILKLFRKVEPGINPDFEMGSFLTEHGFEHTPAVLGSLEYRRREGQPMLAAILQNLVINQGDAWKYTLEELGRFFAVVLGGGPAPQLPTEHPMDLLNAPLAMEAIGAYLDSARLLGTRTAQLHCTLAASPSDPDFAPEPVTAEFGRELYEDMVRQADITFDLLRTRQEIENARELLHREADIRERFCAVRDQPIHALRIRQHGDYHLGQVLYTGTDFVIIDFEGEPARPLSERRIKTLAMRDVAGMIRSFQYAAFAALFGQVAGVPNTPEMKPLVESWAAFWTACVSTEFLSAYFDTAGGAPFLPPRVAERRVLFDVFVLQKALYEVAYELNNRPDWVRIPLHGVLSLVS